MGDEVTEAHSQRAHAKLAPSAAHRWMSCPGSVKLSEGIPNTSSVFAAEGTAAHELCAHCLETGDNPETFLDMWVDIHPAPGGPRFVDLDEEPSDEMRFFRVDEEMVDGVSMYVDHVNSLIVDKETDLLSVEQRLDMTHLHPQIFGTGDATVMQTEAQHLHVVDFKYGKGVAVDADDNPQLMLYAAGAAHRLHNHKISRLTMHIVQPRASHKAGPIRSFDIDLIDLFDFEAQITAGAEATEQPDAQLQAGEWCRFCPAQPICPERRQQAFRDAFADFGSIDELEEPTFMKPEDLSEEQLATVLRRADGLLQFVKAVQQYGHDQAMNGKMPKGHKLVAKRANRKWKDQDSALEYLTIDLGLSNEDIFAEPKMKSPAQLERWFPGKNKEQRSAAMADLVEKKSSGFNLVPTDDPRPPITRNAAEEFEALEGVD